MAARSRTSSPGPRLEHVGEVVDADQNVGDLTADEKRDVPLRPDPSHAPSQQSLTSLRTYFREVFVLEVVPWLSWKYVLPALATLTLLCGFCYFVDHMGNFLFQALSADLTRFMVPPFFSRFCLPVIADETYTSRLGWSFLVGIVGYINMRWRADGIWNDYALLLGVHASSYLFAMPRKTSRVTQLSTSCISLAVVVYAARHGLSSVHFVWFIGHGLHFLICNYCPGYTDQQIATAIVLGSSVFACFVYSGGMKLMFAFLPVSEIVDAYQLASEFVGAEPLRRMSLELLIITVNVQVPLGFLGIAFLRRQQARQNYLLQVGEGSATARTYTRYVLMYIMTVAFPYVIQRTIMEGINSHAFSLFARSVDNSLRIEAMFPTNATSGVLLAAVTESNHTVNTFSDSFGSVVSGSFYIIERKLFSLPKITLLPGMLWSKPWLVVSVLPASIAIDACKSQLIGLLSRRIEDYSQQIQELADRRQRIEQHDTKHEELIRRGVVGELVKDRWHDLSRRLADLNYRSSALQSVRTFVQWLYWQDFMIPGFECALGFLLEIGHITNVDLYLYIRVIEDSIDMLLTRSRLQAELASMETHRQRVLELHASLAQVRNRSRARCTVDGSRPHLRFSGVTYSRGTALKVQLPEIVLHTGNIYAVTGANGCGKSTIFGILASCGRSQTALPLATELDPNSRIELPSDDIVEITQQLYCPLHVTPISWLLRGFAARSLTKDSQSQYETTIAHLLRELQVIGKNESSPNTTLHGDFDLHNEKDDWYGELSGGQRLKMELIANVFLRETCPVILLLDEAFAPLDPQSKMLVQKKLKTFCARSIVLVIYHSDVNNGCVGGDSGEFFDQNLHFANGTAKLVGKC